MFVHLGPWHHWVCKLKFCFQPDWKILQKNNTKQSYISIKINAWEKVIFWLAFFSIIFISCFFTTQNKAKYRFKMHVADGLLFTLNGKAVSKLGHADGLTIATGCTTKTWMLMCYICTEYSQTINTRKQGQLVTKRHWKWVKLTK